MLILVIIVGLSRGASYGLLHPFLSGRAASGVEKGVFTAILVAVAHMIGFERNMA